MNYVPLSALPIHACGDPNDKHWRWSFRKLLHTPATRMRFLLFLCCFGLVLFVTFDSEELVLREEDLSKIRPTILDLAHDFAPMRRMLCNGAVSVEHAPATLPGNQRHRTRRAKSTLVRKPHNEDIERFPGPCKGWHTPWDTCAIILGVESSGTKLAGQLAAVALELSTGLDTLRMHGDVACHTNRSKCLHNNLVVHRSLPHGHAFPNVTAIVDDLKLNCSIVRLVICTRDKHISMRSKLWTHQHSTTLAAYEQAIGVRMLQELVKSGIAPHFIFSYESLMLLGDAYIDQYIKFLRNNSTYDNPGMMALASPYLRDGNIRYTRASIVAGFGERLYRNVLHCFDKIWTGGRITVVPWVS